mmetsp:Transcript_56907/g.160614  ORF Transcript_56907/g.160614 Transcript_56907/m.160614 type:complete len:202 (-) Transcript_56907:156-761(-)
MLFHLQCLQIASVHIRLPLEALQRSVHFFLLLLEPGVLAHERVHSGVVEGGSRGAPGGWPTAPSRRCLCPEAIRARGVRCSPGAARRHPFTAAGHARPAALGGRGDEAVPQGAAGARLGRRRTGAALDPPRGRRGKPAGVVVCLLRVPPRSQGPVFDRGGLEGAHASAREPPRQLLALLVASPPTGVVSFEHPNNVALGKN